MKIYSQQIKQNSSPFVKRPEALAVIDKLFSGHQIKSKGLGGYIKMATHTGNAKRCHGLTA